MGAKGKKVSVEFRLNEEMLIFYKASPSQSQNQAIIGRKFNPFKGINIMNILIRNLKIF
jgi:hypothetical protein